MDASLWIPVITSKYKIPEFLRYLNPVSLKNIVLFYGISESRSDYTCNPRWYDLSNENYLSKASLLVNFERITCL